MKTLLEFINHESIKNMILDEEINVISHDIINESFKSTLIQKLAQKIYDVEKKHNIAELDRKSRYEKEGYFPYNPKLTSFASIFGPITKQNSWSKEKIKVRGIKWNEITDDDFTEYNTDDKNFIKFIKNTYQKPNQAITIITDKNKNPLYFIKSFNINPKDDGIFYFKIDNLSAYAGVKEMTQTRYSYQSRSLKLNELLGVLKKLSEIEGVKAYALEITDSMIKNYDRVVLDRKEAQKGVINYDAESLALLLKQQKARYNILIKKMKEEKMTSNIEDIWNLIQEAQEKVVKFYKEYVSKPEYLDRYCSIGDLMRNISYCYESLIEYYSSSHKADKYDERAKKRAEERGEKFVPYDSYERARATEEINNVHKYLKNIDKEIENIKNTLNDID